MNTRMALWNDMTWLCEVSHSARNSGWTDTVDNFESKLVNVCVQTAWRSKLPNYTSDWIHCTKICPQNSKKFQTILVSVSKDKPPTHFCYSFSHFWMTRKMVSWVVGILCVFKEWMGLHKLLFQEPSVFMKETEYMTNVIRNDCQIMTNKF